MHGLPSVWNLFFVATIFFIVVLLSSLYLDLQDIKQKTSHKLVVFALAVLFSLAAGALFEWVGQPGLTLSTSEQAHAFDTPPRNGCLLHNEKSPREGETCAVVQPGGSL